MLNKIFSAIDRIISRNVYDIPEPTDFEERSKFLIKKKELDYRLYHLKYRAELIRRGKKSLRLNRWDDEYD